MERIEYLKELTELRNTLGREKIRDLELVGDCCSNFGALELEELDHAMSIVYSCWFDDDTPMDFCEYAFYLDDYMREEDKTFNDLDNMDTYDLLEIVYKRKG